MSKQFLIKTSLSISAFFYLTTLSVAQESSPLLSSNKSQYHLFNPTPKELMREMSTDRPDKTESAYTVDAGHYQLELSFIDYTYDHHNVEDTDTRVDNFSYLPTNFKIGLLNNADLQIVYEPFLNEHTKEEGQKTSKAGSGDVQTRLKVNVWGNDGGTTALAVMPFLKYPANTEGLGNDDLEGGVIVPLAISLPHGWDFQRILCRRDAYPY